MTAGKTTCTRNKTINAVSSMTGALNQCSRTAKQLRSDGRAFCNKCAAAERNRPFTGSLTWSTIEGGK